MFNYYLVAFYLILLNFSVTFAAIPNDTKANEQCSDGATASIVLSFGFYQNSCPEAEPIVFSWVEKALSDDPRMAASLLRLHFHDCFVNASHFYQYIFSISTFS